MAAAALAERDVGAKTGRADAAVARGSCVTSDMELLAEERWESDCEKEWGSTGDRYDLDVPTIGEVVEGK